MTLPEFSLIAKRKQKKNDDKRRKSITQTETERNVVIEDFFTNYFNEYPESVVNK